MFKWVGPISTNDWVLFAKKDSPLNIDDLEDVRPYKIGCYQNDSRAQFLIKNGFNASELDDDSLNPKRLNDGLVDFWITSTASGYYYAAKAGINSIEPVFTIRSTQLYLALNKETPDAHIHRLNSILETMRKEGVLDSIYESYR